MKMRTKRRHLNYCCIYNHQVALVLEAAFEQFKADFAKQGGSLNDTAESLQHLGESYRFFKKFAMRFVIAR